MTSRRAFCIADEDVEMQANEPGPELRRLMRYALTEEEERLYLQA
jgi:hypothetical protein